MKQFWLVRSAGGDVEGPFSSSQLRQMAHEGAIARDSLVASEGTPWVQASKVKGLFDAPQSPSTPVVTSHHDHSADAGYAVENAPHAARGRSAALAPQQQANVTAPPVVGQPLVSAGAFAPPMADEHGCIEIGRKRDMTWFLMLAGVVSALGLISTILGIAEMAESFNEPSDSFEEWIDNQPFFTVGDGFGCAAWIGHIIAWALWLAWLYRAHDEMARLTRGRYPISPGLAIGLCFVPLFNLYWPVHVSYKLAQQLEGHFRHVHAQRASGHFRAMHHRVSTYSPPVSTSTVLALQIVAAVSFCIVGVMARMLLIGITMRHLQNGMNQLWDELAEAPAA